MGPKMAVTWPKKGSPSSKEQKIGRTLETKRKKKRQEKTVALKLPSMPQSGNEFHSNRTALVRQDVDYSAVKEYRGLLNAFHSGGHLRHPQFALELSAVFLRCLNTSLGHQRRAFHWVTRRQHMQLMAALGWVYADQYESPLPTSKSSVQSLEQVSGRAFLNCAMELIQLLLASVTVHHSITLAEVLSCKVGTWFSNQIALIRTGVWSDEFLTSMGEGASGPIVPRGLSLPVYLAFRAIHPLCPRVASHTDVQLTVSQTVSILLEPRLYLDEGDEEDKIKLLPPSLDDGVDYNLWYFYEQLRPSFFS
jgi:hypothetical protein